MSSVDMTERLDLAMLGREIRGNRLRAGTLAEELGNAPTLLCFLRHFG